MYFLSFVLKLLTSDRADNIYEMRRIIDQ